MEPLRESVAVYISDINTGSQTEYCTAWGKMDIQCW